MGTRIVPLSAALWATLLRRLNRVGEALQTSPDTLEEPHVRTSVEQGLVELLIMATAHPQEPFRLSASSRAMAMRRVRDYVQEHLEYPITLSDLCRAANLGARTLQIIFREKLRISPMQYVRAARLNRAHSVLHENLCRNVSDAARLSGYWHMAQFAVDYRRMFHETPSATLKRCRRRSSTNGFS